MIKNEKKKIRDGRKEKNEDDLKNNQEFQMEKAMKQMYGQQKWKLFLDKKKTPNQIKKEAEKQAEVEQLLKMKMQAKLAVSMKLKLSAAFGPSAAAKVKKQEKEMDQKLKKYILNINDKHSQKKEHGNAHGDAEHGHSHGEAKVKEKPNEFKNVSEINEDEFDSFTE